MSDFKLYLFGAPHLENNSGSIGLERRKALALLAYLAVTGKSHSRETLATLFWPEADQQRSRSDLRRDLSILNKTLDDTWFNIDRETIGLKIDPSPWVDVLQFRQALAACQEHSHDSAAVCPDCLPHLRQAVSLYSQDFLAGFTLRDCPEFDEWQRFQTEELRRELAEALERLVRGQSAQDDFKVAIPYARRWLALDSLHEPAHRQLMELYARAGQRAAALHQYQTCERILHEELGVPPGVETTALAERIRLESEGQQGQLIKSYELKELIGAGGYGEVYRAYQPQVRREVAIKSILPQYANQSEFIRRFEAEAHMVAQLEHPHIVPLYDYWREPNGAYLVMRWLRGGSLEDALKNGPWNPEAAVKLLDQITGALMLAHQRGIIHRDLKPANILLDENGNAYLTDFGIAKQMTVSASMTQAGVVMGSPAYMAPETVNDETLTPQTDIYSLGVVLFEILTGRHPFPDTTPPKMIVKHLMEPLPPLQTIDSNLPPALNEIIQQATAKKPADRYADTRCLARAFRHAVAPEGTSVIEPADDATPLLVPNPYKGLYAFQEADAADFFGRDALIEQLLVRLTLNLPIKRYTPPLPQTSALHSFLAVVGPSGSGKSSVVKAGLIPHLRRDAIPGSKDWFIVEMTPGRHPFEELESALMRVAVNPPPTLLDQLQADERGLLRVVKHILPDEADDGNRPELLLLIDQFEELFTLCLDETVRKQFLNSLQAAITEPDNRLRVIITLRADFYDRPLLYPGFGNLLRQRMETILPMSTEELDQAIAGPAERVGAVLEPGLVPVIISDVQEQPGTLPLMQYALTELFEHRRGRRLTIDAYQTSGGVMGALARRADELFEALDSTGQAGARRLFLRLVTLGEAGGDSLVSSDTRRRVLRSELISLDGQLNEGDGTMALIIDTFGKHRMLTFDRDPVTRGPTVEVAHEALIREWARLQQWLDADREFLLWQQRLRAGLHQWQTSDFDEGALLRGLPLTEAENWFGQRRNELNEAEREFIQAGLALRERQEAEREAQLRRELEVAQELAESEKRRAEEQAQAAGRLRRRAVWLVGAGLVAVLLAIIAGVFGLRSSQNAEIAVANEQTAVAERATAQAAGHRAKEQEARAQSEAQRAQHAEATALAEANRAHAAEAAAQAEKEIAESERAEAQRLEQVALSRQLAAQSAAEFDRGNYVAALHLAVEAGSVAETFEAFEALRQPFPLAVPRLTLTGHEDEVLGAQWNSDESLILTRSKDNTARVWDAATGQELIRLVHNDWVRDARWNRDESQILTRSWNGGAHVWDASTGREQFQLINDDSVSDARWNADESLILTFSDSRRKANVRVWDAINGQKRSELSHIAEGVKWNSDGRLILTFGCSRKWGQYCWDGTAFVWDAATGQELLRLTHEDAVNGAGWNRDESLILTRSSDETVRVWDAASGQERFRFTGEDSWERAASVWKEDDTLHVVTDAKWNGDGSLILTVRGDDIVRVWDAATGQKRLELAHEGTVEETRWNSDESLILTRSKDNIARMWDAATGEERFRFIHEDWVLDARWNSDESLILTYSQDKTVRVWDARYRSGAYPADARGRGRRGPVE